MLTYGIDFGTSNSLIGAADESGLRGFVPLNPGAPNPEVLRSLLYFPNAKEVFFGANAIQEFSARDHTGRFIRSVKKQLPSRSFLGTYIDNRPFNLEDLIGVFLGELRKRANIYFDQDVTRVVLGRPARFAVLEADDRYAEGRLERAARIAGFKDIEFLPEPVAAAFGYGRNSQDSSASQKSCAKTISEQENSKVSSLVLAADYGGGTSDFTIYQLGNRQFQPSDVISMGGISLAGDALDAALMRHRISHYFGTGVQYRVPFGSNTLTMPAYLMERICHPAEISLLRKQDTLEFFRNVKQWALGEEDRAKMDRLFTLLDDQLGFPLFERIESTKRILSMNESTQFEFNYPDINILETISRKEFEEYSSSALESISKSLDNTLHSAQVKPEAIDRVLCTGGTAKVPWLRQSLIDRFGENKIFDLDPFKGVGRGLMERAFEVARIS